MVRQLLHTARLKSVQWPCAKRTRNAVYGKHPASALPTERDIIAGRHGSPAKPVGSEIGEVVGNDTAAG